MWKKSYNLLEIASKNILHLWWNTNNVNISIKAETHFRTTSMNLLGHLINDSAVKCLRSILNDTD